MTDNANIAAPTLMLSLKAAQKIVAAGVDEAARMGVPMCVVAVDRSGQIKAVAHMDGATVLPYQVAFKKAWTAAVTGAPTAGVRAFVGSDEGSAITMPHLTDFSVIDGGLPILVDGVCVGAVGVSGATAEMDLAVAEAALAGLKA
ncbi:heme-binding protein [Novosphingobium aquae]|uniref:Heme-binding protein n=1 Tax=Novosphingobium aquae TaxID=3133435 RepID=A0ABU8SDA8_9SPHN